MQQTFTENTNTYTIYARVITVFSYRIITTYTTILYPPTEVRMFTTGPEHKRLKIIFPKALFTRVVIIVFIAIIP